MAAIGWSDSDGCGADVGAGLSGEKWGQDVPMTDWDCKSQPRFAGLPGGRFPPLHLGLSSFAPGVAEGDGAVEDGFFARDVVFGIGDEIAAALELTGISGEFEE